MPGTYNPLCANYYYVTSCNGGPDVYVCANNWFKDYTIAGYTSRTSPTKWFSFYYPIRSTSGIRYCYVIPHTTITKQCLPSGSPIVVTPYWQTTEASHACSLCSVVPSGTSPASGTSTGGGGGGDDGGGGAGGGWGIGGCYGGWQWYELLPCADNPPGLPASGYWGAICDQTTGTVRWGYYCFDIGDVGTPPAGAVRIGAGALYQDCQECLYATPCLPCSGETLPNQFPKVFVRPSEVLTITDPTVFNYRGVCLTYDPNTEQEVIPTDGIVVQPPTTPQFTDCEDCSKGIIGRLCDSGRVKAATLWVRQKKIDWIGDIVDKYLGHCYLFSSSGNRVHRPSNAVDYTPAKNFNGVSGCIDCGCGVPSSKLGVQWLNCKETPYNEVSVWTYIENLPSGTVVKNQYGYCKFLDPTRPQEHVPVGAKIKVDQYPYSGASKDCAACQNGGGNCAPLEDCGNDPPTTCQNCVSTNSLGEIFVCPEGTHCDTECNCVSNDIPCPEGTHLDPVTNSCVPDQQDTPDPCDGCDKPIPPPDPNNPPPTDPPNKCPGCGRGGPGGCYGCDRGGDGGGGGTNTDPTPPFRCPPGTTWDDVEKRCKALQYRTLKSCTDGTVYNGHVPNMPLGYVVKIGDTCYYQDSSTTQTPEVSASQWYTSCDQACSIKKHCVNKWVYDCTTDTVTHTDLYCDVDAAFISPFDIWISDGGTNYIMYQKGGVCNTTSDCSTGTPPAAPSPKPCCPGEPGSTCYTYYYPGGFAKVSRADTFDISWDWTPYTCRTMSDLPSTFVADGLIFIGIAAGGGPIFGKTFTGIDNGSGGVYPDFFVSVEVTTAMQPGDCDGTPIPDKYNLELTISGEANGLYLFHNCSYTSGDVQSGCTPPETVTDYGVATEFPDLMLTPTTEGGVYTGGAASAIGAGAGIGILDKYPGCDFGVTHHYNGCCS